MRWVGLILILITLVMTSNLFTHPNFFKYKNPKDRLEALWFKDMKALEASGKLPQGWDLIEKVELIAGDSYSKELIDNSSYPIKLNPKGDKKLEVIFDKWVDGQESGIIIQYHLVDQKTNNTIWELGRSLKLTID